MINTLHVYHGRYNSMLAGQIYASAWDDSHPLCSWRYCHAEGGLPVCIIANLEGNEAITMLLLQGKLELISHQECSVWVLSDITEFMETI